MTTSTSNRCVRCPDDVSEDDEHAVQCDFCQRWTHYICPKGDNTKNISDVKLAAIKEDNGAGELHFYCVECQPKMPEKFEILRDLDNFKNAIDSRFLALENEMASLRRKAAPSNSAHDIQDAVEEALEKEKKRLNAVVVGLPETDKNLVRSDDDRNAVMEIARKLNISENAVIDIFRDGKFTESADPSRPYSRIIKVKFTNKDDKLSFLRGFKSQLDQGSRAYVRHDLTFKQRTADKALRDRLRQLRDAYPTLRDQLVIRDEVIYDKKIKAEFDPAVYALANTQPGTEFLQPDVASGTSGDRRSSLRSSSADGAGGTSHRGQHLGGAPRRHGGSRQPRGPRGPRR